MGNLQQEPLNDNQFDFIGSVGRLGPCLTAYGMAIDIADNRYRPCRWHNVVPTNPEILENLHCGDQVLVRVHKLLGGSWDRRPTILATLHPVQPRLF